MKKIFAIIGSTRTHSSNEQLVKKLAQFTAEKWSVTIFGGLGRLPHFSPDLDNERPPFEVVEFRQQITEADGVIICTPEYIFSLPGSLKNAIEWCVSTTIFSRKPVGLITASASGEKAQEELKLIMKTIEAEFTEETTLLIKGIKGKFDEEGNLTDEKAKTALIAFIRSFEKLLE